MPDVLTHDEFMRLTPDAPASGEGLLSHDEFMSLGGPPKEKPGLGGAFTGAVSRGLQQTWGLAYEGLPALVYSAMGNDAAAEEKLKQLQARFQKAQRDNPTLVESYTNIDSPMALATYIAEAVGENLPSMVPGLGAAGVGLKAGQMMARTAATRGAAGMAGMTAGAVAGSAAQNIPETFADVYQETGQMRPGVALGFGGLKAGLDAIPSVMALKRAFGPAITDKIAGNILKRMGVGAAEQFAGEGATEGAQEALDIAASKYVDENKEMFTRDNLVRIADAGLKGGFGGATIGGLTGAIGSRPAPQAEPVQEQGPVLSDTHRQYLREMGLTDEAIDQDLVRAQTWAERVATRRADDQRRAGFGPEGDWEGMAEDKALVESGDMDPGAQRQVGRVAPPDEPIVVTPSGAAFPPGDLGAVEGAAQAGQVRQGVQQNAEEAFRLADVKRQKGPAYEAARHYVELTDKIGEDPGQFVERALQIPAAQFQAMPIPARDQIIQVALKARRQQAPGPQYAVQDTSGQGPTSAAPAPMRAAQAAPFRGAAENPMAPQQPTSAEIDASPRRRYSQQAVGGSERPFQGQAQDSSGLDFSRDQQGNPVDPRAGMFEQRAHEQAAAAKAAEQEELRKKQEAYNHAREARRKPNADAEQFYSGSQDKRFVSTPRDLDKNGDYPIDQWGFVVSTGGGPMRFTDGGGKSANQKAAMWIKQHGQRRSKYQVFDRANHPSGKGIGIVVTGRNEPPGGAGPGTYGVPARMQPRPQPPPRREVPLKAIQVTMRAFESDSGKVVSYRMSADKALPEIQKNIETAKALLQCLKS